MPLPIASARNETTAVPQMSRSSLRFVDGHPARVHILTYGCSHNQSDSEHLAGVLAQEGYLLADAAQDADIVILNSCTVKGPSQDSFLHAVRGFARSGKPLLVAGCVPQADPGNPALAGVSVLGVQQLRHVADAVAATLDGGVVRMLGKADMPPLSMPKARRNKHVEILPINLGCLHACAYCKTKHARGHLRSYAVDDILARVRRAVEDGVLEIWLTSEDAGAYGRDIGSSLPALLDAILPALPDPVMLRIGMANPPYILEHIDALAAAFAHPRVYAFAHIPVQSGSDAVLAAMRRGYSVGDFQLLVDQLRSRVPGITVATDVICGYPAETADDHALTAALVERNAFPILNISQFYPRPGTPAAALRLLPTQEVKRRSTEITALFKAQRPLDALVGEDVDVWVTAESDDGRWVAGHTKSYILALLPLDPALLGRKVAARVVRAGKHFIECAPLP